MATTPLVKIICGTLGVLLILSFTLVVICEIGAREQQTAWDMGAQPMGPTGFDNISQQQPTTVNNYFVTNASNMGSIVNATGG
jgi:hypothetical protein